METEAFLGAPIWLVQIVAVVGALRLIFKPIFAAIEKYIADSPDKRDDQWMLSVKASKIYKTIVFFVDLLSSVKLPAEEKK